MNLTVLCVLIAVLALIAVIYLRINSPAESSTPSAGGRGVRDFGGDLLRRTEAVVVIARATNSQHFRVMAHPIREFQRDRGGRRHDTRRRRVAPPPG